MIVGIRKSVHFIIISSVLFLCYVSTNYVNAALIVPNTTNSPDSMDKMKVPHLGVNMRGYYTSMPQSRIVRNVFPTDYYDSSFKILSKVGVVDHVRFRFYWESYVKNPVQFIKEIEQVADTADKYGIKVLYDNHQFHTSSWLNIDRGTGFPTFLFTNTTLYQQDAGGSPKSVAAKTWWINWWNNAIRINGTDGWRLQSDFLKKVVSAVDKHTSTLGYEILSEPQVNNVNQWSKIGKYNTFMTNELRKVT